MGQLADMLRSEGGLPYKEAIASTIITIIEDNPEAKEKGWELVLLVITQNRPVNTVCLLGWHVNCIKPKLGLINDRIEHK